MNATTRVFLAFVAMTLTVAWVAVGADKAECKCCKVKKCECKVADAKEPAATKNPEDVWWGNRGVSFRNYMKFDRVELPKPAEAKPEFKPIYFDLDKSVLRPDGVAIADQVVAFMTQNPNERVLIEGYCCDLASNDYNIGLGQRRADAVKKYLAEHGIDASRIDTVSYGEDKRATTAPNERPLNRRAIVVVKCGG